MSICFDCFADLRDYLQNLGLFHMQLGHSRMEKALARLDLPPKPFPVIHVLGTNGKGSTSLFLQGFAAKQGLSVGLFTSPHLVDVRERIRVNGEKLGDAKWLKAGNEIVGECEDLGLTYFEFLTLLAILVFVREKVDLAVLEAGLGGRFDATSVFDPALTVFTSVDRDHCRVLGITAGEIAGDKAGAIKSAPVVCAPQAEEVKQVLKKAARSRGVPIFFLPGMDAGEDFLDLNFRLAREAWIKYRGKKGMKGSLPPNRRQSGFLVPGRLHRVCPDPEIVLDGAHNPHALNALNTALEKKGFQPGRIIFGCFADKDVDGMCEVLERFSCPVVVCLLGERQRSDAADKIMHRLGDRARLEDDFSVLAASLEKTKAKTLVCGSLYLLGRVYSSFPHWLESGENL